MSDYIIKGFKCPTCEDESLTYNGNYYCTRAYCWINDEIDLPVEEESDFILELMIAYMRQTMTPDLESRYLGYMTPMIAELTRRRA